MRRLLGAFFVIAFAAALGIGALILTQPPLPTLQSYELPLASQVYSVHGRKVGEFFTQRRFLVPYDQIPQHVIDAVVCAEDANFFKHQGISVEGLGRALLRNLQSASFREGGSTITQQIAKSLFLGREKTLLRKFRELIIARALESRYTKEALLELYLNLIYFGEGAYGIGAAAEIYFDVPVQALTLTQAATLAGIIRAPSRENPKTNPELALDRRRYVLRRMQEEGKLTVAQAQAATSAALELRTRPHHTYQVAPYFIESVRLNLLQTFSPQQLSSGGLHIYTYLEDDLTAVAQDAINQGLTPFDAKPRYLDVPLQAALISLNPHTGAVTQLIGGRDFYQSPFNRALHAKRQAGSAFKPFIYAAALSRGFTPATLLRDEPESFNRGKGLEPWKPQNYHNRYRGEVLLRDSLVASLNLPTIHLLRATGLDPVINLVHEFGLEQELPKNLSLALGTTALAPLDLARAYAVFANGGYRLASPSLIAEVRDRQGQILYRHQPSLTSVYSPELAFVMTRMLQDVVRVGTGRGAVVPGIEIAGKTGTTDDYRDAWFIGYSPERVTAVWVGFDDARYSLGSGRDGGEVAAPIFASFMTKASAQPKKRHFDVPSGIIELRIDPTTGRPSDEGILAAFVEGTEPLEALDDFEHDLGPPPHPYAVTDGPTDPLKEDRVNVPAHDTPSSLLESYYLNP